MAVLTSVKECRDLILIYRSCKKRSHSENDLYIGVFGRCFFSKLGIVFQCIVNVIFMKKLFASFLSGVCVGGLILYGFSGYLRKEEDVGAAYCSPNYREVRESGYEYIQPLLECDADQRAEPYEALRRDLQANLSSLDIHEDTSMYFRDLKTGMWVGINEDQVIPPASMSKMYVFLAAYKKESIEPGFFDEEFVYRNQFINQRNLDTEEYRDHILVEGETYTIKDLLERMILYSDNEAFWAVNYLLNKKYPGYMDEMSSGLLVGEDGYVSLKNFSNMFRLLYNATYLPKEESEAALTLLTKTSFTEGIVAGVPESVKVASKFGFFNPEPGIGELYRFNHCGIVYHSSRPYLLCLSIPSDTLDDFRESMKQAEDISVAVYKWVDTHPMQ